MLAVEVAQIALDWPRSIITLTFFCLLHHKRSRQRESAHGMIFEFFFARRRKQRRRGYSGYICLFAFRRILRDIPLTPSASYAPFAPVDIFLSSELPRRARREKLRFSFLFFSSLSCTTWSDAHRRTSFFLKREDAFSLHSLTKPG